jgi:hypothetical protein
VYAFFDNEECVFYGAIESYETIQEGDFEQLEIMMSATGDDYLFGGKGDDVIKGESGPDVMKGNYGDEYIFNYKPGDPEVSTFSRLVGNEVVNIMVIESYFVNTGEVVEFEINFKDPNNNGFVNDHVDVINLSSDSVEGFELEIDCEPDFPEPLEEVVESVIKEEEVAEIPEAERSPDDVETILQSAQELIDEGFDHNRKADEYYEEGDCDNWIPQAEKALEKCSAAGEMLQEVEVVDEAGIIPIYYYCIAKADFGLGRISEGITNFRKSLDSGLTGDLRSETEEIVNGYDSWLSHDPCEIKDMWFDNCDPLITELTAFWEYEEECNNPHVVVVKFNDKEKCHLNYSYDDHERIDGITHFEEDGGPLDSGDWTVTVYDVGRNIAEITCDIP